MNSRLTYDYQIYCLPSLVTVDTRALPVNLVWSGDGGVVGALGMWCSWVRGWYGLGMVRAGDGSGWGWFELGIAWAGDGLGRSVVGW